MTIMTLNDVQTKLGAVRSENELIVLHFGSAQSEYDSARSDCALFDCSDRTQIEITGDDRATFLHNFCTNDVKKLTPGNGCEAFLTNVKGKVLGHVFIFATENAIWLESVAGAEESLIAHLDRYVITEDVTLDPRSNEVGELFVSGPHAVSKLGNAGIDVAALTLYSHVEFPDIGFPLSIRRVDWTGHPGYIISVPREHLATLWTRLVDASIVPAGQTAFDVLRIEAGMPLYGTDISEDNLAQEVSRTKQAISFTKGCYLGQEPIARVDAMGHVNRELRGLRFTEAISIDAGQEICTTDNQTPVGKVTSTARLGDDIPPVAMAYLRSQAAARETEVDVQIRDGSVRATVFWPE